MYKKNEDVVVYSGTYTVPDKTSGISIQNLTEIFLSPDFARYASLTGKDMSGGYAAVSAATIKNFGLVTIN